MSSATLMRRRWSRRGTTSGTCSAFGGPADRPAADAQRPGDLALESEAATTLTLRLAGAADRAVRGDAGERAFRRIATAVGKYWVTKRGPAFTAEALECLGGNGYVEDSGMPRHYREAPLLSIWEGSGNVNALDVLRALGREPDSADALFSEFALARGADARLDTAVAALKDQLAETDQVGARRLVERMALALQASPARPARPAPGRGRLLRDPAGRRLGSRVRHPARRNRPGRRPGARPARPEPGPLRARPVTRSPWPVSADRIAHSQQVIPHCRCQCRGAPPIWVALAWGGQRVHWGSARSDWASLRHCLRQRGGRPDGYGPWRPRTPPSGRSRSTGCSARCTTRGGCTTRPWPACPSSVQRWRRAREVTDRGCIVELLVSIGGGAVGGAEGWGDRRDGSARRTRGVGRRGERGGLRGARQPRGAPRPPGPQRRRGSSGTLRTQGRRHPAHRTGSGHLGRLGKGPAGAGAVCAGAGVFAALVGEPRPCGAPGGGQGSGALPRGAPAGPRAAAAAAAGRARGLRPAGPHGGPRPVRAPVPAHADGALDLLAEQRRAAVRAGAAARRARPARAPRARARLPPTWCPRRSSCSSSGPRSLRRREQAGTDTLVRRIRRLRPSDEQARHAAADPAQRARRPGGRPDRPAHRAVDQSRPGGPVQRGLDVGGGCSAAGAARTTGPYGCSAPSWAASRTGYGMRRCRSWRSSSPWPRPPRTTCTRWWPPGPTCGHTAGNAARPPWADRSRRWRGPAIRARSRPWRSCWPVRRPPSGWAARSRTSAGPRPRWPPRCVTASAASRSTPPPPPGSPPRC